MSFKSIEIKGLRGFATAQKLEFAIPNGQPGSGLTFLIGPNNAGKSTIVEALRSLPYQQPQSFTVGKRNARADDRVSIKITDSQNRMKELRTVDSGGSESTWEGMASSTSTEKILVLPSRRYFSSHSKLYLRT
jgi:DNA repair exonuclease SbcCD ATPase subunit